MPVSVYVKRCDFMVSAEETFFFFFFKYGSQLFFLNAHQLDLIGSLLGWLRLKDSIILI